MSVKVYKLRRWPQPHVGAAPLLSRRSWVCGRVQHHACLPITLIDTREW